jgi:trimeric autotransporter adhesin
VRTAAVRLSRLENRHRSNPIASSNLALSASKPAFLSAGLTAPILRYPRRNALFSNSTGITNVAVGLQALYSNTTGSNHIAAGTNAGSNLTYGNNNIDIGNDGVATEGGAIRIGTPGTQTSAYIAGIESAKITGSAVYVTASGRLGVLASSERYKTGVASMGASSEKLEQLRPVSFHLKSDPDGAVQYGLIAEEVSKVYPELVIRDAAGKIQGVRYDELAPLLLNEAQKQQAELRDLKKLVLEMQADFARCKSGKRS